MIRAANSSDAASFAAVIVAAQSTWRSWAGETFQPYEPGQLAAQWAARLTDPATVAGVC